MLYYNQIAKAYQKTKDYDISTRAFSWGLTLFKKEKDRTLSRGMSDYRNLFNR